MSTRVFLSPPSPPKKMLNLYLDLFGFLESNTTQWRRVGKVNSTISCGVIIKLPLKEQNSQLFLSKIVAGSKNSTISGIHETVQPHSLATMAHTTGAYPGALTIYTECLKILVGK